MKTPLDNDLKKVYEAFNQKHDHLRQTLMASLPDSIKQHKKISLTNVIQLFIGGATMKIRITKLSTAAVIIAFMLVMYFSNGSVGITTIAFGDIAEAMNKQPWMHATSRGFQGEAAGNFEVWVNYETKVAAFKTEPGRSQFWDIRNRRKYEFDPETNSITVEYADEKDFPSDLSSPAAAIETMYKGLSNQGAEIRTKSGRLNGQEVQIQEIILLSQGNARQTLTLYIEPQSKLFLASELEVTDANGNTIAVAEMTYSYPQSGPASIYDLGVPRDAEIIDKLPKADYQTIWDNYRQSRADAISEYIAVVTHIDRYPVDVIVRVDVDYKSGRKQRWEGHEVFAAGQPYEEFWPQYEEQLGDSFESLLAWTLKDNEEGKGSLSVYVYDGQYSRNAVRKALGKDAGKWKYYKKHYSPEDPGMPVGSLGRLGWPQIGKAGRIIEDEYATKTDLICIEQLRQGSVDAGSVTLLPTRYLFYLDAHKNYICVRKVTEQCPDAEWQKDKNWLNGVEPEKIRDGSIVVEDITEVIQTADGHWYPKVIVVKQSGIRKDYKEAPLKVIKTKRVYIRTNQEFPKGIFNAEELLGQ